MSVPASHTEAPRVVLLAGGFGTRVAHLLPGVPKPMAPVNGRPFVEWVIRFFVRCGAREFVLSTGHLSAVIEAHFAAVRIANSSIVCRPETVPLGTAGGFLNAATGQSDPERGWLVANADSLVFADPTVLGREANKRGWDAAVLGLAVADTSRYGSLAVASDDRLTAFAEKKRGSGLINAGVYWFNPNVLVQFPDRRPLSFEFEVFPTLLACGRSVGVCSVSAPFLDIGTEQTLRKAEKFVRDNQRYF